MSRDDELPTAATGSQSPDSPTGVTAPFPLAPGCVLDDRYRIDGLAGQGGMGQVYRAFDVRLNRPVAVKISFFAHRDPEWTLREARAMAGISHRHVCRVIEVSTDSSPPYVVMEWVDGVRLDDAVASVGLERRLTVFEQLCEGIAEVHRARLVHRDLKPGNVLVDRHGQPVVVDFGLSDQASSIGSGGTPGFSAPEQFRRDATITPGADVFALGALLYLMLTGQPPRETDANGLPALPHLLAEAVPSELERICLMCLERNPEARYVDASAIAQDLRRFRMGQPVLARPSRLAGEFDAQVRDLEVRLATWSRLGHISLPEARSMTRWVERVRRPESPWVLDTRRLSGSQVWLYLGGWMVILVLIVGLPGSWDDIGPLTGVTLALGLFWGMCVLGLFLHFRRFDRVALVYLVSSAVAAPAVTWLLLRETAWPGETDSDASGSLQALEFFSGSTPPDGFWNRQLLLIFGVGAAYAVLLRLIARSSAFTFIASLSLVGAWVAVFAVAGHFTETTTRSFGELGVWGLCLCVPGSVAGLVLDVREQSRSLRHRGSAVLQRDGPPLLYVAAAGVIACLSLLAYYAPEWYWLGTLDEWESPTEHKALAIAANGLLYVGTTAWLDRKRSSTRIILADMGRWLIPSHLLGSLIVLEAVDGFGRWQLWLILTPICAGILAYLSVKRQWKPFLVSAFTGLAIWYARCFDRIETDFDGSARLRLALTAVGCGAGVGMLILGWRLPAFCNRRRSLFK